MNAVLRKQWIEALTRQVMPFVVLLTLLMPVAFAPSLVAGQTETFTDRTEVRAVHLDVLVISRDGTPVTDLEPSDFRVLEDAEPITIDFFEQPSTVTVADLPSEQAQSQSVEVRRGPVEWIVFVDDQRLDGAARERVLTDLERTLEDWSRTGGVPGNAGLRMVIQRNREVLERGPYGAPSDMTDALRSRPKAAVTGVMTKIARRQAFERLAGVREACALSGRDICTECWGELLAEATRHAVDEVQRVERTSLNLRDLLTRFDPSEGRRSILYVGDGLPLLAGASVLWSLSEQCTDRRSEIEGEVQRYSQRRMLEELGALANAQRTALHLLDAGGLRASFNSNDSEHNRNLQAGLQTLAEETGGSAVLNANRTMDPIRAAIQEEQARYELGFTLTRPATGRVHSIEVQLVGAAAKGREVRYRKTYWDRTTDMRLQQAMQAMISPVVSLQAEKGAPSPLRLTLGEVQKVERKTRRVELAVALAADRIAVLPSGPGETSGQMTLGLLSAGPGERPTPRTQVVPLGTRGVKPNAEGVYEMTFALTVRSGERVFVAAVRDETTGEIFTARATTKLR